SFKIEGRMKSLNYIACVCKAYRLAIDDCLNHLPFDYDKYYDVLKYCENRDVGNGFLFGNITPREQLFVLENECKRTGEFVGIIKSYDEQNKIAHMILRNKVSINKDYEIFSPNKNGKTIHIDRFTVNGKNDDYVSYSVANDIISFYCEERLDEYNIVRLK
ncbi:MAG: U32 family peptidase C-terminal domain-containing protein, partial [Bacilli bacterium]|nr:U32 family peptidase C-terminal domain-containing protein [Bacilli bacterium]